MERELGPALAPLFWFGCLNTESTQWPRLERGYQGGAASGQAGPKKLSPTAGSVPEGSQANQKSRARFNFCLESGKQTIAASDPGFPTDLLLGMLLSFSEPRFSHVEHGHVLNTNLCLCWLILGPPAVWGAPWKPASHTVSLFWSQGHRRWGVEEGDGVYHMMRAAVALCSPQPRSVHHGLTPRRCCSE